MKTENNTNQTGESDTRKPVTAFEIIDHGVDHAQYFQGCGLAFTDYEDIATGAGFDASEAYNDALETLAQDGWDVRPICQDLEGIRLNECHEYSVDDFIKTNGGEPLAEDEESELYYYVSIRVK